MKNGKRAVRKSSVILKGQPPVDPDKNRQALDSRGGFDFYIYKNVLSVIMQHPDVVTNLTGGHLAMFE